MIRRYFLFLVMILLAGACSGGGGCGGCNLEELPEGGLPADQTIEGGGQLRISETGFAKLTDLIPALINDSFRDGSCLGERNIYDGVLGEIDICYEDDASCSSGCQVDLSIDSIDLSVPREDQLRILVQFDVTSDVPVNYDPPLTSTDRNCTVVASASNVLFDMVVSFEIDEATGELALTLLAIDDVDISIDIDASDCGVIVDAVASLASGVVNAFSSLLGVGFIRDLLTPVVEPMIQNMLPDPLGVEGIVDVGGMLAGVVSGVDAKLETRVVPGGYVKLENGGMSLGLITGFNTDLNIETRSAEFDSEPVRCVPPFSAPDFAAAPSLLGKSIRDTFSLNPADMFRGIPETGKDIIMGASETTLDQLGHHLVTSGALCISLGTENMAQLTLGTIGIFVPSLAELGTDEGNDPVLLVIRPNKIIDFSIGDGTSESPAIGMEINQLSIDFYAFIFERYVRGFTVTLDLNVGINLEFTTDTEGNPAMMPILSGLESKNIGVTISNEELLLEDKAKLEMVFPVLLDLVLPAIAGNIGTFALPEIGGFKLENLSMERVITSEDEFIAFSGDFGASAMMTQLGQRNPKIGRIVDTMQRVQPTPVSSSAKLVRVIAPKASEMLLFLQGERGGREPGIVLDLDTHSTDGRTMEWTWNVDGGLWRPLIKGGRVILRDGAFYAQGKYELQLRARAVGDYHSWGERITRIPVVIDSVGPNILPSKIQRNKNMLTVSAYDLVYQTEVELAFGRPSQEQPETNWSKEGTITVKKALALAEKGMIEVFARDPQGNQQQFRLHVEKVTSEGNQSGGCSTGGGTNTPGLLLLLVGLLYSMFSKKTRQLLTLLQKQSSTLASLLVLIVLAFTSACDCGADARAMVCELNNECLEGCTETEIPECFEGVCRCLENIPLGEIGKYSSMAVSNDGLVWVSAYNQKHGDLMVASTREYGRIANSSWEFVDGVPEGPVLLPKTANRDGIKEAGNNVGLYTDLIVREDGVVMISHFDATSGSLKFTSNQGGTWHSHVVDTGAISAEDGAETRVAGQYSSISLNATGVPSIAYFAHARDVEGQAHTEVLYAEATSDNPSDAASWTIETIDTAQVPAAEAEADVLTVPYGTGLFVEMVRDIDDFPVLAYYDRVHGDLKMARLDKETTTFIVETLDSEGDVGWYPSLIVDQDNTVHLSYVDADNKDLLYINSKEKVVQLVDDGYRVVGTTEDGLPIPEFHFVGDDSSIILSPLGIHIAYQDATSHELLLAKPDNGTWGWSAIAGHELPFAGAYGFYANAAMDGNKIILSSFVLDQRNNDSWVEIMKPTESID